MTPFLLVSGDFVKSGGMDRANYALADYLARRGAEVHLVAHHVEKSLAEKPTVVIHRVPKILDSYAAAEPLLDRVGRKWAAHIRARGGRVIVNGGNCQYPDVNWVHYMHAAYAHFHAANFMHRLKAWAYLRISLRRESRAIRTARLVIANSRRTKTDLTGRLGIPDSRVQPVYYGIDDSLFRAATPDERARARAELGWTCEQPVVIFVGALGDRRKGFDTVLSAWLRLCADPSWDATLAVVGSGTEVPFWREQAEQAGIGSRIQFLGRREDVPRLLAACDALVAPTRYEAFGLAVHEALCCGLPAFVSKDAGVAEEYPKSLEHLLVPDPNDALDLAERLKSWRRHPDFYRAEIARLAKKLRLRTWDHMAAEIVDLIEAQV